MGGAHRRMAPVYTLLGTHLGIKQRSYQLGQQEVGCGGGVLLCLHLLLGLQVSVDDPQAVEVI